MKKTLIASAISLSLGIGSVASVQAQTITITQMNFFGATYAASGTLNSNGDGSMQSIDNFFGNPWVADQQAWFSSHSSTLTWSGTGTNLDPTNAIDNFTYTFHLSSNQVAVGTYFDWNGNNNIPVLTIFDCPETGGGACTGNSLPMAVGPFAGADPGFNGVTTDDFLCSNLEGPTQCPLPEVPIPAAVWLFGSGLIGLAGFARRRRII